MKTEILITGATGTTGQYAIQHLLKKGKKDAPTKKESSGDMVALKEFAEDPRAARVKLRAGRNDGKVAEPDSGRWEWKSGSKELDKVKKYLGIK